MARSIWDRMLAGVGLQKMDAGPGGFRAARHGRLSNPFEEERRHLNSAVASGGATLRARSRFHTREGGLLLAGKETWVAYSVGTGLTPTWPTLKAGTRKALHAWFNRWAKTCDFDGGTTYFGLTAMVDAEVFEAGEVFVRLIRSENRALRLQLICSEQLPYDQSGMGVVQGNEVRLGIEFSPSGERVAYHFYRDHPGDGTKQTSSQTMMRVPAAEILHVFKREQPGQLRGIPQTRAALIRANKLEDYDTSMLERANAGSAFAVFIEREGGSDRGTVEGETGPAPEMVLEAGSIIEGEPGEKATTISPPDPGNNYDAFTFRQSSAATSAMGVPYAETTGDLRKANYSSSRVGRQPFKRRIEQRQQFTLVPQFCDPVVLAALADALLRGDVALPRGASRNLAAYDNIDHIPQAWEYVDPRADSEVDIALVDNLMKSRSAVVAERGGDPEELDAVIAADQQREKKLKLERRSKTAVQAPADGTAADAERAEPAEEAEDDEETED